jgi:hypothetical protein
MQYAEGRLAVMKVSDIELSDYTAATEFEIKTSTAAWAAFRDKKTTWINDKHGNIAAIVPIATANLGKRTLTINEAARLADLIHAVERSKTVRWYPRGNHAVGDKILSGTFVLRAFTHEGGAIWFEKDGDIRDAHVWCSGISERWLKVSDIMQALANATTGYYGDEQPMAVIEEKEET